MRAAQVAEQESAISELRINANQYQELADLASDQAKAMEELHGMHLGARMRTSHTRCLRYFLAFLVSEVRCHPVDVCFCTSKASKLSI